jgi:DNA-binding Lrp family transcriptional regulator
MLWNAQRVAYVEVDCVPQLRLAVAEELARDQHALSVELTVGGADLFLTVAAADLTALSGYLLDRLARLAGVTATRSSIATRLYRDGSGWRLGALPRKVVTTLPAPVSAEPPDAGPFGALSGPDRGILVRLGLNGRASYAELAEAGGVSEPTARRRVARLLRTGAVLLRAEIAGPLAGWPVLAVFSVDVPVAGLDETARALSRLRQVRLCATVAGTGPMVVAAWLHELEEIHRFELALARLTHGLTVRNRMATLRPVKRMGRLLDEHGRAVGAIPMDIWRDPLANHR